MQLTKGATKSKIVAYFTLLFFEVNDLKKIKIYSEFIYVIALLGLPLSVAILAAADFGLSMIVAPAYIISEKIGYFSLGEWAYIVQALLFIGFCIAMKRVKLIYFASFITCVIYGYILDMWQLVIPLLNPDVTAPGSMDLSVRILMFITGELLTSFTVMLFFKSYIYPQVCDFFVMGLVERYNLDQVKFKRIYDISYLVVSIILSLALFGAFVGIEWGTVVIAVVTSPLIGVFAKWYDKHIETVPLFPKFEKMFKF